MKPEKFCEVCCKVIDELTEEGFKVTCRQCRKTFHTLCTDMILPIAMGMYADELLCRSCQPDMGAEWNEIVRDEVNIMCREIQTSQVQRVQQTGPQLPVEIWAIIFRKLSFNNWCNARLVNSRCKSIIDGDRSIMNKFFLHFPRVKCLSHVFLPVPTLPASTIRFCSTPIEYVGSWWSPQITANLAHLKMHWHPINFKLLLTMLRYTPNLVSLSVSHTFLDESVVEFSDLQLWKMEKLTIGAVNQDAVLEIFSKIFPRLKDFSLKGYYHKSCDGVFGIIKTVPSLEGISLNSSSDSIFHWAGLNRQFKRVSLKMITVTDINFNDNLISFSQKQPLLECFSLELYSMEVHIDDHVFTKVFQNLPRLKRLSMKLAPRYRPGQVYPFNFQSIGCLTELEHLTFRGRRSRRFTPLFAGAKNPKLKELHLIDVVYSTSSSELREYIANAPNLHTITLEGHYSYSYSELFAAIPSKGLLRLKLSSIRVRRSDEVCLCKSFDVLQYLELSKCKLTERFLSTLFGLCPRLEELHLSRMENVSDAVVLVLCQEMKQLRTLAISKCAITDASARHIAEHGLNLEQLTIENCEKLTTEGVTQLRQTRIAKIKIKLKPADNDVQDKDSDDSWKYCSLRDEDRIE